MNTTIDVSSADGAGPGVGIDWRRVAEIGSTNDELLAAPFAVAPQRPRALRAERQLGGRGRRGRRWVSEPGSALTFSVALERATRRPAPPLAGFSLAVGTVLAEVLVARVPDIALKWPNDLVRAGGKAGGILVETRRDGGIERVVVGIGLNLRTPVAPPTDDRPEGALPPIGLFDNAPIDDEALWHDCATAVVVAFERFLEAGFAAFAERWRRFDALHGAAVVLHDAGREIARGTAAGIDASGALTLRDAGRERCFAIGEVSLRLDAAR